MKLITIYLNKHKIDEIRYYYVLFIFFDYRFGIIKNLSQT